MRGPFVYQQMKSKWFFFVCVIYLFIYLILSIINLTMHNNNIIYTTNTTCSTNSTYNTYNTTVTYTTN